MEESRSWSMKKLKLLSLVGITSMALVHAGLAASHGGGGGGFGGGFSGGGAGHAGGGGGGARFGGGPLRGGGGVPFRGPRFRGRPLQGRKGRLAATPGPNLHHDCGPRGGPFFRQPVFFSSLR